MLKRRISQAYWGRKVAALAIAALLSGAAQAREYSIERGGQYDLCHEVKEVLKKVPEGVDPMCGLPEAEEGSLLANLEWEPYDYGGDRDFLAEALHQGSLATGDERYQSITFKEFESNQPDGSSVKRSKFRFEPGRSLVPIYKLEANRCESGDYRDIIEEKETVYPRYYTPDTQGLDLNSTMFDSLSDIFLYNGRYYAYNFSATQRADGVALQVHEFNVAREQALRTRVCRFIPQNG